jgi:hypothetical protein
MSPNKPAELDEDDCEVRLDEDDCEVRLDEDDCGVTVQLPSNKPRSEAPTTPSPSRSAGHPEQGPQLPSNKPKSGLPTIPSPSRSPSNLEELELPEEPSSSVDRPPPEFV